MRWRPWKVESLKLKIVEHLFNYGPRTAIELARALKKPKQTIHYNLIQLVKEGVLIKADEKYYLQPLFWDENYADMYLKMIKLMTNAADYIMIGEDVDEVTALFKNFEYFLWLNIEDLKEIIKKVNRSPH